MNIFIMARQQLKREGKLEADNAGSLLIDRAITIRKAMDVSDERREAVSQRKDRR
jgi:hypothetical protein